MEFRLLTDAEKTEMRHLEGRRVRLLRLDDPYTRLAPGAEGTITFVDDTGTVFVDWDSGAHLGLIQGPDEWEVLPQRG